ncbi:ATP-binding protein [Kibdelosporangium aridum]|uniref:ATP-binding protein n=1 Tax=Kibdelosporangium aridum TaxID=2030 RepID=UPI0035EF957C
MTAVHRTIAVVDVEGFGDDRRTNPVQVTVRKGLYEALRRAFDDTGIPWTQCYTEDRGDGVFILGPTDVQKSLFVESLPLALVKELRRHNAAHPEQARIRLRLALHAGEVVHDAHGVTGKALNLAFRLCDAPPLKAALAASPGLLAVISSEWFYEEVVRNSPAAEPASYRQVQVGVKETTTHGWICLPDHPYRAPEPAGAVPRQLPSGTPHFVGREQELARLDELVNGAAIVAINGAPGVGKTALAVHWGHRVRDQFPDGQLYIDLRGFDISGTVVQPVDAIRGFLDAFDVPPDRIPPTPEGQAALYRRVVARRRLLIVLDNARDVEQVRALLPGSSTCVVVVTSRNQLVDLITWEGARPVNLGEFAVLEAKALVVRRIGAYRVDAEPEALVHLIDRCARVPLAVAMMAARLELNPALTVRMLADELADEATRLDALDRLRSVFAASYQQLGPTAALVFRLLGMHPGSRISTPAVASLAGIPIAEAKAAMTELVHGHLVMEVTPGCFAFHDLLRSYAANEVNNTDTETIRRAAVHRLLDYYLHTGFAANSFTITAYHDVVVDDQPQPGVTVTLIQHAKQAKDWLADEYRTVLLLARLAHEFGFDVHAWKLPWAIGSFLEWNGHWHDLIAIRETMEAAIDRLHDDFAHERVHLMLGWMYSRVEECDEAHRHTRIALDYSRKAGDHFGEAACHFVLAMTYGLEQNQEQAFHHANQTLEYFERAQDGPWQARTHRLYAWACSRVERYQDAVDHCAQGLRLLRQSSGSHYEVAALEGLYGWALSRLGMHREAVDHYTNATVLYQELTDVHNEAEVLRRLGDTLFTAGDVVGARATWEKAMVLVDRPNLSDVERIQRRLRERLDDWGDTVRHGA